MASCSECNGLGIKFPSDASDTDIQMGAVKAESCASCNGSGEVNNGKQKER